MLIAVYVDDILIVSKNQEAIINLTEFLSKKFEIKKLGDVKYCLGIEFSRDENGIVMNQRGYINDILDRFGMLDSRTISTPLELGTKLRKNEKWCEEEAHRVPYRELVGALMYLAVCTRPDIAYVVSNLSQYNSCYDESHWIAAKRVLKYLKGTANVGLHFKKNLESVKGYVDADWANCQNDRRSYTGYAFILGGSPISWESRKQRTVALSSTEAEYMALSEAAKEAMYLARFLREIGFVELANVNLFCDNNGARKLAENPVYHNRTKHIDVRHHFVREVLQCGYLQVNYISTEEMAADILTKGLSKVKHAKCLELLGLGNVG